MLGRLVLANALRFEQASSDDYAAMAARTSDPELRRLLDSLAAEESQHLAAVRKALDHHGPELQSLSEPQPVGTMAADPELVDRQRSAVLTKAAAHEQSTARFYEELASAVHIRPLRGVLLSLAEQERQHAVRLNRFLQNV